MASERNLASAATAGGLKEMRLRRQWQFNVTAFSNTQPTPTNIGIAPWDGIPMLSILKGAILGQEVTVHIATEGIFQSDCGDRPVVIGLNVQ